MRPLWIGEVAQPVPVRRTFDYEIPESLLPSAHPGVRVRAPFGPRSLVGTLLSVRRAVPERALKAIDSILDAEPFLGPDMLELASWLARRYGAAPGDCHRALLPAFLKHPRKGPRGLPGAGRETAGGEPVASAAVEASGSGSGAPAHSLTQGQSAAVSELAGMLRRGRFAAAILFGVPASGKTEVYLRLMREAVSMGGQTLYLLPEISLTYPFFDALRGRAGFPIALWHSRLGTRARRSFWAGVRDGSIRAVIGARSACLLPFKALRLAVVDEEQDESYKQEAPAPCYHAREVVLERARRSGALVLLGSATPSLEAVAAAESGGWPLLRLNERVFQGSGPRVEIVGRPRSRGACLGPELLDRIKDRLGRREQVILLANRRGYSNFALCRKCGWVARCAPCGVAYIHHQEAGGYCLRCHHCGRREDVPRACAKCGEEVLAFSGIGTQRVVSELESMLPGARVLRMDRDSVCKEKGGDSRLYERFRSGQADILVGTKLVAKGYHFPDVTLVGVVDADTMLHMPDFRVAERTVQLLLQAAGRSGRAEKAGEVLLQSAHPSHYALQAVARGDYLRFVRQELEFRKELHYPPFSTLLRAVLSGTPEGAVRDASEALAEFLRRRWPASSAEVLGPSAAVILKARGRFRHHLLLKLKQDGLLEQALSAFSEFRTPAGVRARLLVDPYDLF